MFILRIPTRRPPPQKGYDEFEPQGSANFHLDEDYWAVNGLGGMWARAYRVLLMGVLAGYGPTEGPAPLLVSDDDTWWVPNYAAPWQRPALWSDEDVLPHFIFVDDEYWWSNRFTPALPPPQAFVSDEDTRNFFVPPPIGVDDADLFPLGIGGSWYRWRCLVMGGSQGLGPAQSVATPFLLDDSDPLPRVVFSQGRPVVWLVASSSGVSLFNPQPEEDLWRVNAYQGWVVPVQAFFSDEDVPPRAVLIPLDEDYWWRNSFVAQRYAPAIISDEDVWPTAIFVDEDYWWVNRQTLWRVPIQAASIDDDVLIVAPQLPLEYDDWQVSWRMAYYCPSIQALTISHGADARVTPAVLPTLTRARLLTPT